MLQSMTGYGKASCDYASHTVTVEIKSLNSKGMDISTRVPAVYREKDIELRNIVSQHLVRGKVDLSISLDEHAVSSAAQINRELMAAYYQQIVSFSEAAVAFCREKGAAPRTAMLVGLFVEEMAYNIVEHGFTGAKAQSVDIRLSRLGDGWRIRIKDACREFDPVAYAELFHPEDPLAHVGIRLVSAMSTDMEYVRSLSMNNLILTL